ncbi:hypothetical protein [Lactococcus garvieae]|uniref:hypothetical protein n=1 Tax=Lactococcus garvieae TaxID=1363 RepID=UPI00324D0019
MIPKIISVKILLSNGIDKEEQTFKVENTQTCYDTIDLGDYVLLPYAFHQNAISVGRVIKIDDQSKEVQLSDHLENIVCVIELDELKLIEGMKLR